MDIRVKVARLGPTNVERQEILTGVSEPTLGAIMGLLEQRHPELAPAFKPTRKAPKIDIFVNNTPVPQAFRQEWSVRDGDTVSLLLR